LWFERLNNHSNNDNGEASDEMALYSRQFKDNTEIVVKLDINRSNVIIEKIKMAVITVEIRVEVFIALIVAS
jgi:hypothetical protein